MASILRIILLLFLPVFFWAVYSFLPTTISIAKWELPKMEKIELLSYTLSSQTTQITCNPNITPTHLPNQMTPLEINTSEQKSKKASILDIPSPDTNLSESKPSSHANDTYTSDDSAVDNNDSNQTTQKIKIFLLGDSMGEGVTYGLNKLKKEYPIAINSIAKCSTTTHYWNSYSKLEEKILNYNPSIIIIVLGTNECNYASSSTKLRIMKLHKRLSTFGTKVIWVTPPIKNSSKFFEMVYDAYGTNTFDSRDLNVSRGSDHIHLTPKGYVTWSRQILSSLDISKEN